MNADTVIRTGRPEFDGLLPLVRGFLERSVLDLAIDGQRVRGYRTPDARSVWIRDHSDMMRAFRHFEPDVRSAVQHFADTQAASGRVFDYVTTFPEKPPCERENWTKYVRVPVEADVERAQADLLRGEFRGLKRQEAGQLLPLHLLQGNPGRLRHDGQDVIGGDRQGLFLLGLLPRLDGLLERLPLLQPLHVRPESRISRLDVVDGDPGVGEPRQGRPLGAGRGPRAARSRRAPRA